MFGHHVGFWPPSVHLQAHNTCQKIFIEVLLHYILLWFATAQFYPYHSGLLAPVPVKQAWIWWIGKCVTWNHKNLQYDHGKTKHTQTKCIFRWTYHKTSSISRTKFQNLNVSCILMQLSSLNSLKPGVKLIMKMLLEQRRQAMLQLHLGYQQFYCLLRCDLY